MATYHFVTDFEISAAPEEAWAALAEPVLWPSWWRWLRTVDLVEPGRPDGVGARYRATFGTPLGYGLALETETVRVARPVFLESRASGELAGSGLWQLFDHGDATHLRYTWIVVTTRPWMNLLAPIARPAFSWNHDALMRDLAHGFARHVGAELAYVASRTIKPYERGFAHLPSHG